MQNPKFSFLPQVQTIVMCCASRGRGRVVYRIGMHVIDIWNCHQNHSVSSWHRALANQKISLTVLTIDCCIVTYNQSPQSLFAWISPCRPSNVDQQMTFDSFMSNDMKRRRRQQRSESFIVRSPAIVFLIYCILGLITARMQAIPSTINPVNRLQMLYTIILYACLVACSRSYIGD